VLVDAAATSALDQLSGLIADIRTTTLVHYETLLRFHIPTADAAEMTAELQTVLLELLLPRTRDDRDDDD
jgi:hypothetical protein